MWRLGLAEESAEVFDKRRMSRIRAKVKTPLRSLKPDGSPVDDILQGTQLLCEHWAEAFRARRTTASARRALAGCAPQCPSDVASKVSPDAFEALIQSRRDTAPDLDGVPWSVWKAAPTRTLEALNCSYEAALDGEALPPD